MTDTKLGRNFSDLMEENKIEFKDNEEILEIELFKIKPNPDQPRTVFDEASLNELAESIKEHGVIQPVILKPAGASFILVAGERRVKAARIAGLRTVPCIVRDYNSIYLAELAILENLQREDLTPIEEAIAFSKALSSLKVTHEELGKKIGKSRVYVTNIIGLLTLPTSVIEDVNGGRITMGHARALSKLKDNELCLKLRDRIIIEGLTVRDIEKVIRELSQNVKTDIVSKAVIKRAEESLQAVFQDNFTYKVKKNQITLKFDSEEELNKIIEFLKRG